MTTNDPIPDKEELSRFVAAIFKRANRAGLVLLQAYPGERFDELLFAEMIALNDPRFLDVVCERALETAKYRSPAAFCPPARTFDRDTMEPLEGLCISLDADFRPNTARQRLEGVLGPATIVVASGGNCPATGEPRLHLYWRLATPAVTSEEQALLRDVSKLATRLAIADRHSLPLRWPGSWHRKGEPKLVRIIFESETEIDLNEALRCLDECQLTDDERLVINIEDIAYLTAEVAIPELLERFEANARDHGLHLLQYLRGMIICATARAPACGS